jgi:hypothetical protein
MGEDAFHVAKTNIDPLHKKMDFVSQPQFEGSVRSPLTLPKMGLESPSGLPKTQSSIAGVKTPRLDVFSIPLERT